MTAASIVEERLLASQAIPNGRRPFLTVAIPHYQHPRYLEIVLDSVFAQDFADFELVVSDDNSPDNSNKSIPPILARSGCAHRYYAQPQNLGYDGNVRFCLAAAQGRYVMLLGNDDALDGPSVLGRIASSLAKLDMPAVAFTNLADYETGAVTRRALATRLLGRGPDTAIGYFRSLSFVSGIIFERSAAEQYETDRWDGSVFYQIFLGCRIVAAGGSLGAIDVCAVRKDVRIDGQTVPNYVTKWADAPYTFRRRPSGLDSVIRVTVDALLPFLTKTDTSAAICRIIRQILLITYPYWLIEYRRVANWSFAVGIARDMWPASLLAEYRSRVRGGDRARLWALYLAATVAGLVVPGAVFTRFQLTLADAIRHRQQMSLGGRPTQQSDGVAD